MDTALEAIFRQMLNQWEMIESNGDLNDYYLIFGYCVFDNETREFITREYSHVIDTYGDPFADVKPEQVFYVTMNDAGIINYTLFNNLVGAEKFHTELVAEYERFNSQCESCGRDHNETTICER